MRIKADLTNVFKSALKSQHVGPPSAPTRQLEKYIKKKSVWHAVAERTTVSLEENWPFEILCY